MEDTWVDSFKISKDSWIGLFAPPTNPACPNLIKVDVTFETVGSRMILNALNISAKTLKNVRVCNSRTTRAGKVLNLCGGIPVFNLLQRLDHLDQLEVEDGRKMIAEDVVYAKKHPCDIYPEATSPIWLKLKLLS
ncbi:hypothetical protein JCM5353_001511 [Sporobolomyces roseus]